MGLLEELQKRIAATVGEQVEPEEPEAKVAASPEFQGGLADLIAKAGLGGIIKKFEEAGKGDLADSWVGKGENKPATDEDVRVVFHEVDLREVASKLGIQPGDISKAIAKVLPSLIDGLTPNGKLEEADAHAASKPAGGVTDF